jgi:hypothetical protein
LPTLHLISPNRVIDEAMRHILSIRISNSPEKREMAAFEALSGRFRIGGRSGADYALVSAIMPDICVSARLSLSEIKTLFGRCSTDSTTPKLFAKAERSVVASAVKSVASQTARAA